MKKYILILTILFAQNVFANKISCSNSEAHVVKAAFKIIESKKAGLCNFFKNNIISKTVRNTKCETMYHAAARYNNKSALKCLESKSFNIPVEKAYEIDNKLQISFVEYVIKYLGLKTFKSYNFDYSKDTKGNTPLFMATRYSNETIVSHFIKKGDNVNVTNNNGLNVLMIAAMHSTNPKILKVILNAGADINVRRGGWTALMFAARHNQSPEIFKVLLKAGSDINATSGGGSTALLIAASNSTNPEGLKILLKAGADINVRRDGWTALMFAAQKITNPEIFKVLLKAGADINATSDAGWTALLIAVSYSTNPEVLKILLKAGADINARSGGWTALMFAAQQIKNPEIFKVLLKAGADINATSDAGSTALMIAQRHNNQVAIKILEKL